jgi:hypothetical protein
MRKEELRRRKGRGRGRGEGEEGKEGVQKGKREEGG